MQGSANCFKIISGTGQPTSSAQVYQATINMKRTMSTTQRKQCDADVIRSALKKLYFNGEVKHCFLRRLLIGNNRFLTVEYLIVSF